MNIKTRRTFETALKFAADGNREGAGRLRSSAIRSSTSDRDVTALFAAIDGAALRNTIKFQNGTYVAA